MHLGATLIQRKCPSLEFLTKGSSPFHYIYDKKMLSGLVIFENTTAVKKGTNKATVCVPIIDKIRGVCKKNKIKGFYSFVNAKHNVMIRIKVSDEKGETPCRHKITRRHDEPVNYLFDLSDDKNIMFIQCSSTAEN